MGTAERLGITMATTHRRPDQILWVRLPRATETIVGTAERLTPTRTPGSRRACPRIRRHTRTFDQSRKVRLHMDRKLVLSIHHTGKGRRLTSCHRLCCTGVILGSEPRPDRTRPWVHLGRHIRRTRTRRALRGASRRLASLWGTPGTFRISRIVRRRRCGNSARSPRYMSPLCNHNQLG